MKIIQVIISLANGGAEKFVVECGEQCVREKLVAPFLSGG